MCVSCSFVAIIAAGLISSDSSTSAAKPTIEAVASPEGCGACARPAAVLTPPRNFLNPPGRTETLMSATAKALWVLPRASLVPQSYNLRARGYAAIVHCSCRQFRAAPLWLHYTRLPKSPDGGCCGGTWPSRDAPKRRRHARRYKSVAPTWAAAHFGPVHWRFWPRVSGSPRYPSEELGILTWVKPLARA